MGLTENTPGALLALHAAEAGLACGRAKPKR